MKVAFVTSGYLPIPATKGGAVETIIDNFIEENEKNGKADFVIYSIFDENAIKCSEIYKNTKFKFIKAKGIIKAIDKIIYTIAKYILKKDKTMSYRYIVQRLYFLKKVSKDLKKNNYDKIILENHATLFLTLKWNKNWEKYKGKYYYHLHNEIKSDYGCTEIMKHTKKVLCVSNYIKKHFEAHTNIGNRENIVVLKNCVDTEMFNKKITDEEKKIIKEKYKIRDDEKILVFTGRLTKEKGIMELLQAIRKIKYEKVKLIIVGSFFFNTNIKNNFHKELEEMLEIVKNKVIFTGYIEHSEINKIYAIADIAVLPSIWDDPAPLTIIESMSSGLPIITTDSGGIPEYAINDCAVIIKRDNQIVENITYEIDKLLRDEEKRKYMSKMSLKNSEELNLDNFYNNLINEIK